MVSYIARGDRRPIEHLSDAMFAARCIHCNNHEAIEEEAPSKPFPERYSQRKLHDTGFHGRHGAHCECRLIVLLFSPVLRIFRYWSLAPRLQVAGRMPRCSASLLQLALCPRCSLQY
jgi:hypothetical protein